MKAQDRVVGVRGDKNETRNGESVGQACMQDRERSAWNRQYVRPKEEAFLKASHLSNSTLHRISGQCEHVFASTLR